MAIFNSYVKLPEGITCYNPINYSCYSSAINPGFGSELNQLSRYCLEASLIILICTILHHHIWVAPKKDTWGMGNDGHIWPPSLEKLCLLSHGMPWDMFFQACPQIFRENPSNTRQFHGHHGLKLDPPNILPTIFRTNNNSPYKYSPKNAKDVKTWVIKCPH